MRFWSVVIQKQKFLLNKAETTVHFASTVTCRVASARLLLGKEVRSSKEILHFLILLLVMTGSTHFFRDFWISERMKEMTTAYLEKVLGGLFHTRPNWLARAWNDAAETILICTPVLHPFATDGDETAFTAHTLPYFCLKFTFDLGSHKGAKTNYIELGSEKSNTFMCADWA